MFTPTHKKSRTRRIRKSIIKISLFLFLIIIILIFLANPYYQATQILLPNNDTVYPNLETTPTNISNIVFSIAGVVKTWHVKKHYVESWWRPNVVRGFLFLDQAPIDHLPWSPTSPPVRVSSVTMNPKGIPHVVRIAHAIQEIFKTEKKGARWYLIADDDTVFFLENLVEVLKKYDHNGYYYVGMNAESIISNNLLSFGMGFGGAGFALSYPLAEVLTNNLDVCLKRYHHFQFSDQLIQACVADLGVSLTQEKGFHQIDLHGDISGLLSAHPHASLLSLHHLDMVEPLFPAMNRRQSLKHLMKAARTDESRILQQSICYNHHKNWSFSLSWGYSVHIYEKIIPPSLLQVPIQTFTEWLKGAQPAFMVNTRTLTNDSCEIPHYFYFDSVEKSSVGGKQWQVMTSYIRRFPRQFPPCLMNGNHSADYVEKILVISPVKRLEMEGSRRECCDIVQVDKANVTMIKLRPCIKYEISG